MKITDVKPGMFLSNGLFVTDVNIVINFVDMDAAYLGVSRTESNVIDDCAFEDIEPITLPADKMRKLVDELIEPCSIREYLDEVQRSVNETLKLRAIGLLETMIDNNERGNK